jgi:hypothetical protein
MALKSRSRRSRWHLWLRLAGLTGLMLLILGLAAWRLDEKTLALWLSAIGGGLVALAILGELRAFLPMAFGRRGSMGFNVFLQIVLALFALVGVNVFSFVHYLRWDLTTDQVFTIPANIRTDLARLNSPTTIVLHLRHVTFGQPAEKLDNFDAAAERKVMEKVKDLVDQFQELGPRFKVVSLDVQEERYQDRLNELTADASALRQAIDESRENSIFFYADGKVQRLGFNEIYQLDKKSSQEANGGKGNLTLLFQGVEPFARKILNLNEKTPRIAVSVVHEILGMEEAPDAIEREIGMSAARKVFLAHGFQTRDIILQKTDEEGGLQGPAVYRRDESIYERLEQQLVELNESLKTNQKELNDVEEQRKTWAQSPLSELNKKYVLALAGGRAILLTRAKLDEIQKAGNRVDSAPVNEQVRKNVLNQFDSEATLGRLALNQMKRERQTIVEQMEKLNVDELSEQRRITDLKAKMNRLLADCDLLIVPRMTLINAAQNFYFSNRAHKLDDAQLDAIKEFIFAGKPVLFCLGPANDAPGRASPFEKGDQLEDVLGQLGFKLPNQTILFDVERKAYAERRGGLLFLGTPVEVPSVRFDPNPDAGYPKLLDIKIGHNPNELLTSMRLAARGAGKSAAIDFRLRNPRPVYFDPPPAYHSRFCPTFMMTSADCWNSDQPFATREGSPRYSPSKPDDPNKDTVRETRKGPFPIAAAVEAKPPDNWASGGAKPADRVRVAVIGHGGVFSGASLKPIQERLLLDTCNWLLGRDELLAHEEETWTYPRVHLTENEQAWWTWGTLLASLAFFPYLGGIVWFVRRMR